MASIYGRGRSSFDHRWLLLRQRQATGTSASILAAYAAALSLSVPSVAKTPGEVHCYNGICHRVKSVDEMKLLVGSESDALTSFYDTAERDRMNAGTVTSSGETFDADSDSHAASSLYPDGTELLVWNPKNRKAAHIRVNDFGPFYMLRTIDVTRGVAEKLEFTKSGVAKLRVIIIWAPSSAEARFSRRRVYPAVEGYLGRLDPDQLAVFKMRLIATGPLRNGHDLFTVAATSQPPSLGTLPAYEGRGPDMAYGRARAAVLNTPRPTIALSRLPGLTLAANKAPHALGSPAAIAAASLPLGAIVAARDVDVSTAVASLSEEAVAVTAPITRASPSQIAILPAVPAQSAGVETAGARAFSPNVLVWQHLLAAIGLLSVAAVTWRTRTTAHGLRVRTRSSRVATGPIALPVPAGRLELSSFASPVDMHPLDPGPKGPDAFADTAENAIALPQLPHRANTKSLDDLFADAIGHLESSALSAAEASLRQIIAIHQREGDTGGVAMARAERLLADCLRDQGRYVAAEPLYRRALAALVSAVGDAHPATGDILDAYAVSQLRQGYGADAERTARRALSIRRVGAPISREHAVTLSIVAEALRAQGHLAAAENEHRAAWSLFIAVSGQDSLDCAASMMSLGTVLGELERYAGAEELLNAGTRSLRAHCGSDHPATAMGYALLGEFYRSAGALDAAASMLGHALAIRARVLGERHPDTWECLLLLASVAHAQFRAQEARQYVDRARHALGDIEHQHLGPQSRLRSLLVALAVDYPASPPMAVAAE